MKKTGIFSLLAIAVAISACSVAPKKDQGTNEQMMKDLAGAWLRSYVIVWMGSFSFTNVYNSSSDYRTYESFSGSGGYANTNYSTNGLYSYVTGSFTVDMSSNLTANFSTPYHSTNSNIIMSGTVSGYYIRKISSLTAGVAYSYAGKGSTSQSFIGTWSVYNDHLLTNLQASYPTNMSFSYTFGDDRDYNGFTFQ